MAENQGNKQPNSISHDVEGQSSLEKPSASPSPSTRQSLIQNIEGGSASSIYAVQDGDQHIHHHHSSDLSEGAKSERTARLPKGPSRILLPFGAEDLFFPITPADDSGRMEFGFDAHAMPVVVHELISHGAIAVATHAGSGLAKNCEDFAPPLAKRIKVLDSDQRVLTQTRSLTRPLARSLGFDPDRLGIIDQPITASIAYLFELPVERRRLWSDVLLVMNCVYQLLLGVRYELQIDIPLENLKEALLRVRQEGLDDLSGTSVAFLLAAANSYEFANVGSFRFSFSQAPQEWVSEFERFVRDSDYHEYGIQRRALGWADQTQDTLERTWALADQVTKKKSLRDLVRFAIRTVGLSKGLPKSSSIPLLDHWTGYLPPVVSTVGPILDAQNRWQREQSSRRILSFEIPELGWMKRFHRKELVAEIDAKQYRKQFKGSQPIDFRDQRWQAAFERYFAVNLNPGYWCREHAQRIIYDDVTVGWVSRTISFRMMVCCESAARGTCMKMSVWDENKDYQGHS